MSNTQAKLYGDIVQVSSQFARSENVAIPGTVFEIDLDQQLTEKHSVILLKAIVLSY